MQKTPRNSKNNLSKSVFFFSLHKCATSFFSHTVLPLACGRKHVDQQTDFYLNNQIEADIHEYAHVYGVLRIVEEQHPVFDTTQSIVRKARQLDCPKIILIRYPHDILVSMYFSFGFSHGQSPNLKIQKYQDRRRNQIQMMSIDEYVISESSSLKKKFDHLTELAAQANSFVLKYEDLISDFDEFYRVFSSILPTQENVRQMIFEQTRPNLIENPTAHKRSGKTFGYREKLKASTIQILDEAFADTLQQFDYPTVNDGSDK